MLPSLARQLGKAEPIVACDDGGARLAPAWAQVMRDVLVHAFRNSLDHGFEPPDQRQAHGKPAQGRISVHLDATDGGAVIRVADDGRGLPLGALRQRAQASDEVTGAASDEEVASTIFISGVSTATRVSATSGRGVGMDAIRSFVQRAGGEVRVAFTAGGRDGYRPFELVFEVPDSAVVADGREPTGHPRDPLARAARL
jgi:two-component system chemotaxis sensor kinase CheA